MTMTSLLCEVTNNIPCFIMVAAVYHGNHDRNAHLYSDFIVMNIVLISAVGCGASEAPAYYARPRSTSGSSILERTHSIQVSTFIDCVKKIRAVGKELLLGGSPVGMTVHHIGMVKDL